VGSFFSYFLSLLLFAFPFLAYFSLLDWLKWKPFGDPLLCTIKGRRYLMDMAWWDVLRLIVNPDAQMSTWVS